MSASEIDRTLVTGEILERAGIWINWRSSASGGAVSPAQRLARKSNRWKNGPSQSAS
jgi:hypothetical protein